ncbi:hypothetical protein H4582DRAFT_2025789 [Lactarius indigo]|nr:hypothetical protein H4582DRAFT_2025789 [Lactarius indigo]
MMTLPPVREPLYPIKVQVCPCSRRVLNKTYRRHRVSGLGLPKSGAVIDQTRTQRSGSKNLSIECLDTLLSHASHERQSKLCWMNTKIWIKEFLDRTFGYLSIARFSWMTTKVMLDEHKDSDQRISRSDVRIPSILASIIRFSWMTIKVMLDGKAHEVKWIDDGDPTLVKAFESGVGHDKGRCTVTKDLGPSSIGRS